MTGCPWAGRDQRKRKRMSSLERELEMKRMQSQERLNAVLRTLRVPRKPDRDIGEAKALRNDGTTDVWNEL